MLTLKKPKKEKQTTDKVPPIVHLRYGDSLTALCGYRFTHGIFNRPVSAADCVVCAEIFDAMQNA